MTTTQAKSFSSELSNLNETPLLDDQFIDMNTITAKTMMSDKWFYQLIKDGKFPNSIKFGKNSRWLKSEVEQWLQKRVFESRGGIQ